MRADVPCTHLALAALAVWLVLGVAGVDAQPAFHPIVVESPAIASGETMPRVYTPDGRNLSPPLTWSDLPEGTRQLAVVCADFGAGNPPPWVHWIIYGIPATASGLPEGLPIAADQTMPDEIAGAREGSLPPGSSAGWSALMLRGRVDQGRCGVGARKQVFVAALAIVTAEGA